MPNGNASWYASRYDATGHDASRNADATRDANAHDANDDSRRPGSNPNVPTNVTIHADANAIYADDDCWRATTTTARARSPTTASNEWAYVATIITDPSTQQSRDAPRKCPTTPTSNDDDGCERSSMDATTTQLYVRSIGSCSRSRIHTFDSAFQNEAT